MMNQPSMRVMSKEYMLAHAGECVAISDDGLSFEAVVCVGGGLESYQNSAMSAAVMAYVYRDADDNIVRVFEPLRRNDITASRTDRANSIDAFPFDNINFYQVTSFGGLFNQMGSGSKIKQTTILADAVINFYGKDADIRNGFIADGATLDIAKNNIVIGDSFTLWSESYFVAGADFQLDFVLNPSAFCGADIFNATPNTIISVNQSTKKFTVSGNHASEVNAIVYVGDTGLKGYYTVVSATNNGGNTDIVVTEEIPTETIGSGSIFFIACFSFLKYVDIGSSGILTCQVDQITINELSLGQNIEYDASENVLGKTIVNINSTAQELKISGIESYQNSAMSVPVMAYVYRDESDNIYGVYEPTRNNKVYRKSFAYADSIDKFPFDSTVIFNNTLNDVKLITISSDVVMQGCTLDTMVLNGNNHTGFQLINHAQKGNYGLNTPNAYDINIAGNGVILKGNNIRHWFLDGLPANTSFMVVTADGDLSDITSGLSVLNDDGTNALIVNYCQFYNSYHVELDFQNNSSQAMDLEYVYCREGDFLLFGNITMYDCFFDEAEISATNSTLRNCDFIQSYTNVFTSSDVRYSFFKNNMASTFTSVASMQFNNIYQQAQLTITACANFSNNNIYQGAVVTNNGHDMTKCDIGIGCAFSPSSDQDNKNIVNIGGTAYELGVTAGAVTAVAV